MSANQKIWQKIDNYINRVSPANLNVKNIHVVSKDFDLLIESFSEPHKSIIKASKKFLHRNYTIVKV